ncbi:MAG: Holliday junction resolvase RuvX [Bacilli bacterium]|jgi:putative Holliday junction resolvase|nr:Holliday junction resolvase RuvX [Bacilli bacterium]CDA52195.1 putative Holliday junction resolvase [Clostridium sp. CAG:533]
MKYLAMDLGTKRLGLAISTSGVLTTPYKLISFKTYEEARDEVIKIIEKEKITCLVLGLPKNMDNSMGFASERSLNFKKLLEEKCSLPVNLVDERLSTVEAESILIENNYSRAKRKNVIDELSACIILDTYLRKVG